MKGLAKIPSLQERAQALEMLQFRPNNISLELVAIWTQWARFDARLAEVLVGYFSSHWEAIHAVPLNREVLLQPWPNVLGVLLDAASYAVLSEQRKRFHLWRALCLAEIAPGSWQLFFIGLYQPSSKGSDREILECTKVFFRWGFFSKESLLPTKKQFQDHRTLKSKVVRKRVLETLLAKREPFTVEDYMRALNFQVSRRQAQRDLKENSRIKKRGFTRSRVFTSK